MWPKSGLKKINLRNEANRQSLPPNINYQLFDPDLAAHFAENKIKPEDLVNKHGNLKSEIPINRLTYQYRKPENLDAFVLNEGLELENSENILLCGPRFEANSVRRILNKLN